MLFGFQSVIKQPACLEVQRSFSRFARKDWYLESRKHSSSGFSDDHFRPQLMKLFPKWFRFEGGPGAYKGGVKRPLRANLLRRIRAVLGRMMIAVMTIVVVAVVATWLDDGRRGWDGRRIRRLGSQRCLGQIWAAGSLHPSRRLQTR